MWKRYQYRRYIMKTKAGIAPVTKPVTKETLTKLEGTKWKPIEWPTLDALNKLHEDKTLTGTARKILEKSST